MWKLRRVSAYRIGDDQVKRIYEEYAQNVFLTFETRVIRKCFPKIETALAETFPKIATRTGARASQIWQAPSSTRGLGGREGHVDDARIEGPRDRETATREDVEHPAVVAQNIPPRTP